MSNPVKLAYTLTKGDLFAARTDAIAHGCNTRGVMGAGIAKQFKKREPPMFLAYEKLCKERIFGLGSAFAWMRSDPVIFNLGTQITPGPVASLGAIQMALGNMADLMEERGLRSVGLPMIGCGLGGLTWHQVKPLVEEVAGRVEVTVFHL